LGQNSYNLLSAQFVGRDLSAYLCDEFAGEYLDRYTLRKPKASMPLYHLVGALDPLTDADSSSRSATACPRPCRVDPGRRPDPSEDQSSTATIWDGT